MAVCHLTSSEPPRLTDAAAMYDVEDIVFGHVRFANGFWLSLALATSMRFRRPRRGVSVHLIGRLSSLLS
jgi:hypothetical protein